MSIGDKLLVTLKYYRGYMTMESIADDYDCSKSAVCRSIHWVKNVLTAGGRFQLPGKKKCHTVKPQIIADVKTRLICDGEKAPGSMRDFTLCKKTLLFVMVLAVIIFADRVILYPLKKSVIFRLLEFSDNLMLSFVSYVQFPCLTSD